jgi:hypothetical protein
MVCQTIAEDFPLLHWRVTMQPKWGYLNHGETVGEVPQLPRP